MLPWVIIGCLALVMAGIATYDHLGKHVGTQPDATPVRSADLLMQDHDDGSISVYDARSHALVDTVPPATNGFLRVVLAGMVRERRREDIGDHTIPFHLTRWSDGRLTLDDTATHKLIELEAFGTTNEAAFGRLLELSPQSPTNPPPATAPGK